MEKQKGHLWARVPEKLGAWLDSLGPGVRTLFPLSSAFPHPGLMLRQAHPLAAELAAPGFFHPEEESASFCPVPKLALTGQMSYQHLELV